MKKIFILLIAFCFLFTSFIDPVYANELDNSISGISLTDPDVLNLVYDENIDLEKSYEEKGLMSLTVSRTFSESDDDYCKRFEQVAKEQTAFAVAIPDECLQYFETSQNILPVTYFYPDGNVPYFVTTAFLVTGGVIALGGILAATYFYQNSDTFVNSVYGTFNKLADNAKTNLSNLFNNNSAYNNIDTNFINEIHSNFELFNGSFANPLGFRYSTYYPYSSNIYNFDNVLVFESRGSWKCALTNFSSGGGFKTSVNGLDFNVSVVNNLGSQPYLTLSMSDYPKIELAEEYCSMMNFGHVFLPYSSSFGQGTSYARPVILTKDNSFNHLWSTNGNTYTALNLFAYSSGVGLFYPFNDVFWHGAPSLNVDEVDFYKNGSVTMGRFPENLLDYTQTDVKTGAITGVYTPPMTNTQTGEKVETVVPTTPPPTTGGSGGTTPPNIEIPENNFFAISFEPLYRVGSLFEEKFPFSLISDIQNLFNILIQDPVTPYFEVPFPGVVVPIDLSPFNNIAYIFRNLIVLVFAFGIGYSLFKRVV